jgi:hypothetical protein
MENTDLKRGFVWKFPSILDSIYFLVKLAIGYSIVLGLHEAGHDGTITNGLEAFHWLTVGIALLVSLALSIRLCAICGIFKNPWNVRLLLVSAAYVPFGGLAFYILTL